MVKLFILRTRRITAAVSNIIRFIVEDQAEHKREGNEKRDVRKDDVEVGTEDFSEHFDIMRNLGFRDNPHEIQIQLKIK